MTTSYEARNNSSFLMNNFPMVGEYGIAAIKKAEIQNLEETRLISYSNAKYNDLFASTSGVHFFVDDYKMESIAKNPDKTIDRLSQYRYVLTPDYSLYQEMPLGRQIDATLRSRWVGAYWQSKGLQVIPTVSWGNSRTYSFTLDTIEKGSVVAISTLGVRSYKKDFLLGFNEMVHRIKPDKIICYGNPLEEIRNQVIYMPHYFEEVS